MTTIPTALSRVTCLTSRLEKTTCSEAIATDGACASRWSI